ncbi:MAG TPA: UrcA family protein [Rhizomicrobium sp.]|jgi:UrcA family protein
MKRILAMAGVLAFCGAAAAQDYGYDQPVAYENVPVIGQRIHIDPGARFGDVPEKLSASSYVRYDDLDLSTRDGARELRFRVREAARDICRNLIDAYPVHTIQGQNCYKDAADSGLVKADEAIAQAREDARYNRY